MFQEQRQQLHCYVGAKHKRNEQGQTMTIASQISFGTYTAGSVPTVTANAQPAITSVGTLTNLAVSGNIATIGNLSTGIISANGNISSSGNLTLAGTLTGGAIRYMFENANIIAASPPVTTDINVISGGIQYWTGNATSNVVANIRGDSTTSLNSLLAVGQTSTIAFMLPQATAYFVNFIKVDNANVTPVWQGGATVAVGNANSIDLYTFTIVKTANATFRIFASQTRYQHTG